MEFAGSPGIFVEGVRPGFDALLQQGIRVAWPNQNQRGASMDRIPGRVEIVERRSSDQAPLPAGASWFEYQGQPYQEDADITAEALYDADGRVRATRDRWLLTRRFHVGSGYSAAPQVRQRGVIGEALLMLATLAGIVAGAVIGGIVGALAFHAPGMLGGAAVGGWVGGTCALGWARGTL